MLLVVGFGYKAPPTLAQLKLLGRMYCRLQLLVVLFWPGKSQSYGCRIAELSALLLITTSKPFRPIKTTLRLPALVVPCFTEL
jgi:hypothetical protein